MTRKWSLDFRPVPHYRTVELVKLRLRDALEKMIKRRGGVHHAIIRDAFLNWDVDASGKLDPTELVRHLYHPRAAFLFSIHDTNDRSM